MTYMLLSIVIPMYKVEPYVARCLESVLEQKGDFEVIAVDDGSPDRSGEIARYYSDKDARLKVIRQPNMGLSAARNTGMRHAAGEYIWFIDSDDWVSDDSIEIIEGIIRNQGPEAIHLCGADVINDLPVKLFSLEKCQADRQSGIRMLRENNFHGVVQYTVYKRSFLKNNGLFFMEGIYHEDTEFSPRAYYFLKDIICVDKVLYLKRVNEDSITRKQNVKKNFDLIKVSESLYKFACKINDCRDRQLYMRYSANALKMAMSNEYELMDTNSRKSLNAELRNKRSLLRSFYKSDRMIYKVQAMLLSLMAVNMLFAYNRILCSSLLKVILNKKEVG